MKKWKRLLAALLAVTMICTMASCAGHKDSVGKDVTVTFYNGDQVYETITAKTGEKLTLPEAPKAEKGLGLAGWSTIDGDVEGIIDPETYIVRGDLKLYAVWADVFTVTINADNGSPFEVVKVLSGTLLEKPADPVKEGSRFVEWRDALKDVTFDFSKPIYDDVILKAMYGDGSPNRVSDTKWDFSGGIHGAWIGAQGGWKYEVNGLRAEDMVYKTTEDGYAAWGFTLTDSLENIPEVNGNNAPGLGMKYIYNEGISVEASKAKLAVIYLKPKYFPIDMATSPNDQFRISVLTSNGGMIYGYGNGSDAWSLRTDGAGADMIQVDQMEDGWLRVQFKIHKLDVWSEDAILKSMSISFVQRKATPVMDIISVKSIELLDQEEFIDPHKVERTTKSEWDMSNSKDAADWDGYHAKKKHDSLDTKVTGEGMAVNYQYPGNGWKGLVLENALLDIGKLTGELSFTYSSTLPITSYRIHILTDLGGKLTANGTKECYVSANVGDIELGKLPAWRRTVNADGSYTVYFDLNSLDYYANGSELKGLTIVTVTANKVTGTVTYKSIAIEKDLSEHDCEVEGHYMKEASCIAPMTCYVCGATEGGIEEHTWEAATCLAPKTCSVCRTTEGTVSGHSWKAATCQTPKTCSVCGRKEGDVAAHSYKNGFCTVCGIPEVIRTVWDMSNEKAAADWSAYHAKKKNEALTTTVTYDGMGVEYKAPGNGWKGIILEKTLIETSKLTGKLTFTYSSDMPITSYRIHILTDRGGKLTANGTDACYVAVKISDITAGKLPAWTQTTNADGSVTVTFDLNSLSYFANGKALKGLTIVTVTSNNTTGTVTYKTIDLELDAAGCDCQADGHMMKDATCTEPKTCRICGATEGEAAGHTWVDATCAEPKTCSVCGTTEGEPKDHEDADGDYKCDHCGTAYCSNHNWSEATCTAPKTCSICGATEGTKAAHTDEDKNHLCDVCAGSLTVWYMNQEADAAAWAGYHAKKKNEKLTATVTEAGLSIAYGGTGNGWKGVVMENVALDISKLGDKLIFTYSSDMDITNYRIHIRTDLGGDLTDNGTADCYTNVSVAAITAGNLAAWTQTTNADGTVTVTFDLNSMSYFADGTELKGLTIVTVTANGITGNVTYKFIALDDIDTKHDCQQSGHNWINATCSAPKTCSACGTTEGEALDHTWVDADCVTAKTCSVCGTTEGEALGHTWVEDICLKTCYTCGATESTSIAHTYENGSCSVCGAKQWDTDGDGVLEILTLGNSFSVDATEYSWQIAKSLGIDKVVVGNLYIGSCSLNTHMANASADRPNYRYYYCDDGTWTSTENYKLSTALESRSWDYVSLQQASGDSGVESTYNEDLTNLIAYVRERSDAKLVWHMTWAYQQNSTHSAFPTYNSDQMTMYNAIVSAVQNKIVPNGNFALIVPNGTAVQNTRTSLVGDTLTRDGYHMSKDYGRYLTGLMFIKTVTGLDISGIEYAPDGVSSQYREIAIESVNNAYAHPFEVTQSAYQSTEPEVIRTSWDMSKEEDAADWAGYHAKKKNEALTTTVTEAGLNVTYGGSGNGWKGIVLEGATIDISKLTGKLTFTYSSDMAITNYRIHILTDLGGNLTANGTADNYVAASIADITAGNLEDWTQTTNPDGSVTVTFDLSTLGHFANGTQLRGLTIVTVTANKVTGTVTYKSIELEKAIQEDGCQVNGHTWTDATCTAPKTCSVCGATEGEPAGHTWTDATCTAPKTCSVCGATEGEALGHSWKDATCQAPKTCSTCGATEGELGGHADENGDSKCDICEENLCTNHSWKDATCTDPKTCELCGTTEGEALGHDWTDADCDTAKTCNRCGATEGEALGHDWADADCDTPKTCNRCGATEGEALGHDWADADCDTAKTCNTCGATEGEALGHTWSDATCQAPKTCSTCGATEGSTLPHADSNKDHVCEACSESLTVWYMNQEADAADWTGYHAMKKNEKLTTAVTEAGMNVNYLEPGNGWKGVVLENVALDIKKLDGKLTFTYSSDMAITNYRIHILTDLGGNLTDNKPADKASYYISASLENIKAGNAAGWTQTTNADGTVTVTFDLTTLAYFANGTQLNGLTIVTVTANKILGDVTYKFIGLESVSTEHNCQVSGHIMSDATCTTPKTCSMCGATEGEALGHDWADADCDTPKTCSTCGATEGEALGHDWADADCDTAKTCNTCGATEGEALGHTWKDATCQTLKTCERCGATEGELGGHTDENGDRKCDLCEENLCTDHSWKEATCTDPKTCEHCGATEGEAAGHSWVDATCTAPKTCSVCGATEGEALGHDWADADCDTPKTCNTCGATEGEAIGHSWVDATCTTPKTCSVCGETEGEANGHNFVQSVCTVCSAAKPAQNEWNMSNEADAADWAGYHAKKKNEALTTTVTEAGFGITYETPGNGWKGVVLENVSLDISKLTGKLTFTYSSDMAITNYRIHILTDLGGSLTDNGTADCYTAVKITDITAGNLEGWTQTTNPDGSVTVTFDLATMGYFKNGTKLQGLTIVTVTANKVTGTVTYKSIELEELPAGYDCQVNGHVMKDATCTEPKTCTVCGATEGEALGHAWVDADCDTPKTCSVCGETEGEAAGHNWTDATCTEPKTCTVCGATEGEANGHSFAEGVCTVCGTQENAPATPIVWNMSNAGDAGQWYCAQAYTEVRPTRTYSEITSDGFTAYYGHKNAWKGIILKDAEFDITGLSGLLSFTYHTEDMDITEYRVHVLTDQGGDLGSNTSGTPANYYAAIAIGNIDQNSAWTRTENADGSITVTFDLTTLPYFAEGTKLLGMDIVTVCGTVTGEWHSITYRSIEIR